MIAALRRLFQSDPEPVKMILHCPACHLQHVDAPEYAGTNHEDGSASLWDNPPHRSHLCHGCGHIWRPADVPTEGVQAIQTRGKADSPAFDVVAEPMGNGTRCAIEFEGDECLVVGWSFTGKVGSKDDLVRAVRAFVNARLSAAQPALPLRRYESKDGNFYRVEYPEGAERGFRKYHTGGSGPDVYTRTDAAQYVAAGSWRDVTDEAPLPLRRFEHAHGFMSGAAYVEFPEGSPIGYGARSDGWRGMVPYSRSEAEAWVKDGLWREVQL